MCKQMENELHQVCTACHFINRMLENAVWEEDMVVDETIIFNGTTHDFVQLLLPLLDSDKLRVNGVANRRAVLRSIDRVFKILHPDASGFIKFETLEYAARKRQEEE